MKLLAKSLPAIFILSAFTAQQAYAQNTGKITFTGNVSEQTCKVEGASANWIHTFRVSKFDFNGLNSVTADEPINIKLSDCATNKPRLSFTAPSGDYANGNLINKGTATNIEIQLVGMNDTGGSQHIYLDDGTGKGLSPKAKSDGSVGLATRLVSKVANNADIDAGTINAMIEYELDYN